MNTLRSTTLATCGAAVLLLAASTLLANERPTSEEIAQYKADGTFAQRLANAYVLGNHRADPGLVALTRWRLERAAARALGRPGECTPPPARQGGLPATGSPKVLVLLVDFPDYPHYDYQTVDDVQSKFFGDGDAAWAPYESLHNYYQRASYDTLGIQGNVLGWYRAAHNRSYYSDLGMGPGEETLIMEALDYYDAEGHDFTQYDNDGDGTIEAFYLKWTGPDSGWAQFWWAYEWSWFCYPSYRIDGKELGHYVWSWISSTEGGVYEPRVDIHETGHLLGLPDLYDYEPGVGPDGGVGNLDMMDANWGDHNCFSKFMLGWLAPATIVAGSQTLTLNPSGTSQDCVLIMPGVTPGEIFDEFFMVQYRKRSIGNDPADYPNDGLTIWHIDSTLDSYGWDFLYDNSCTDHKLVRLMEADGLEEIEQGYYSADAGDFYCPPATFGPTTVPDSSDYGGELTGVQVDQLTTPGATAGARFSLVSVPDYIWGPLGSGMDHDVDALTVFNGELVAGGSFSTAGGVTCNGIARWDGSTWQALGSGMGGEYPYVYALAVYNGELIAGGEFTTAGGVPCNRIARWDGSAWHALGSGIDGTYYPYVQALTVFNGELIAGGCFTSAGGMTCNGVARWNGSAWQTVGSGMNDWVECLTVFNNELIAGGWFSTAGGVTCNRIARWDGSAWQPLGAGMDFDVCAVTVFNGELIAGGHFTTGGGVTCNHIARWNGSAWQPVGSGMSGGDVYALTVFKNKLIAGGYFSTAGGVVCDGIARWDGSAWRALGSGIDDSAYALTVFNNGLIAGGYFTTAGDVTCDNIARWAPSFQPGDVNCDAAINAFDIDPFVLALTDPPGYLAGYPDCDIWLADVNQDGAINAFDIDPFVAVLVGH